MDDKERAALRAEIEQLRKEFNVAIANGRRYKANLINRRRESLLRRLNDLRFKE